MKKLIFIFLLFSILAIGCTQLAKKTDTSVDADLQDNEQETSSDLELNDIDELEIEDDLDLEEDLGEIEDSLDFDF